MWEEACRCLSLWLHGWRHYPPLFHRHRFWLHEHKYIYYNYLSYLPVCCRAGIFMGRMSQNRFSPPPPISSAIRHQKVLWTLLLKPFTPFLLNSTHLRDRSRSAYIFRLSPICRSRYLLHFPCIVKKKGSEIICAEVLPGQPPVPRRQPFTNSSVSNLDEAGYCGGWEYYSNDIGQWACCCMWLPADALANPMLSMHSIVWARWAFVMPQQCHWLLRALP